jgi:hypothetical protein
MKKLYKNEQGEYCFEFNGVEIVNPIVSMDSRWGIQPEFYGFEVWSTGGGCTAHVQEFDLDGKTVLMLLTDGNLNHINYGTKDAEGGLFDSNMDECFHNLQFTR